MTLPASTPKPIEPDITIGSKRISRSDPAFIVAEIGTAHGGDEEKAKELIDAAAEGWADCAKFQLVFADEIIHPETGKVDLPGGSIDLYKSFKALERSEQFYRNLKEYTESKGLFFLCTPFGRRSAAILQNLQVEAVKIASPELNHYPLLEQVNRWTVPIILSSGVSTLSDIEATLSYLTSPALLLHCVTSYPAPPEEYNLNIIPLLSRIFGIPTGVSDHSRDPILVPSLAAALGAGIIEKHITLDNSGTGLDDKVALNPRKFKTMVQGIRGAEADGFEETVRKLIARYSTDLVEAVLGTGRKDLSESEKQNYRTTNRSIHALTDLPAGTILTDQNVALLRSEKNLPPGLFPKYLPLILGKALKRSVFSGKGIVWEDIL
jgi:N-acetylneuraminate synthase